ncbi:MAG: MFS transporter [Bacillota bacterium]
MTEQTPYKKRSIAAYRWAIFSVLAIAYFFVYFHRVSTAVMVTELRQTFHLQPTAAGFLASVYFYSYAAAQLFVGMLSDRYGARATISGFLFLSFIGATTFALARSFPEAVFARALVGLGVAGIYVPALKVLSQWFGPADFATLTGVLLSVGNVGGLVGTGPVALIVSQIGWRATIAVAGIVSLVLSVICWLVVKNRPAEIQAECGEAADRGGSPGTPLRPACARCGPQGGLRATAAPDRKPWYDSLSTALRYKQILLVGIVTFTRYGSTMGFQALWGGPYLVDVCRLSRAQAGSILALISVGFIIGAPLAGYLSDKVVHNRKTMLIATYLLYALSWVPFALFTGHLPLPVLALNTLIMGIAGGAGGSIAFSIAKESVPPAVVGSAVAALNIFPFIGAALYQPVMGYLVETQMKTGPAVGAYETAFKFCLVTVLAAAASLPWVRETMQTRKASDAVVVHPRHPA